MSNYRSQTAIRQAQAGAAVCARAGIDYADAALLAEAAQAFAGAPSPVRAVAVVEALRPTTLSALETLAPQAWPTLETALLTPDLTAPEWLAEAATQVMMEAERSLGAAARVELEDAVRAFLAEPEQGFQSAEIVREDHVTAVHAVRAGGLESVLFQIDDRGGLEHEYAGHAGTSCEVRAEQFEAFARLRGIPLDTTVHEPTPEGRQDGARMILDAVRRDPAHPARGAAKNAEEALTAPSPGRSRLGQGIFAGPTRATKDAARTTAGGAR